MFNFKKVTIKILILTIVAVFNCCLPTTMAFQGTEEIHHHAKQNKSCPTQEKPDLDLVDAPSIKVYPETKIYTPNPNPNTSNHGLSKLDRCYYYKNSHISSSKFIHVYSIWGYSSSISSGVFRL